MKKNKKRKSFLFFLAIVIIIISVLIYAIYQYIDLKKYDIYKQKIDLYGFNILYNNESATSYQSVTKYELLKLVIGVTLDNTNINNIENNGESDKDKWINYALKEGILEKDEQDSVNKKASYLDLIKYISRARYYILDGQYGTEEEPIFKDYNNYSDKDKIYIKDLVSSGIISNSNSNLNGNKKINKAIVNKLLSVYYERNTLSSEFGILRENQENMPKNVNDFPYILENVDNAVYEEKFEQDTAGDIITPIDYYSDMKEYYIALKENVEGYYDQVLNIDYRQINATDFKQAIQNLCMDAIDDYTVEKYVEYVKANKIIINGKSTVQMPIVYNDGFYSRARTKLEINVESTDTMKNILFLDLEADGNITYKEKSMVIYVDSLLGSSLTSKKPSIKINFVKDVILNMSKDNVIIEDAVLDEAEEEE